MKFRILFSKTLQKSISYPYIHIYPQINQLSKYYLVIQNIIHDKQILRLNLFSSVTTKRSKMLKNTYSFQLQVCLSEHELFMTTKHWRFNTKQNGCKFRKKKHLSLVNIYLTWQLTYQSKVTQNANDKYKGQKSESYEPLFNH